MDKTGKNRKTIRLHQSEHFRHKHQENVSKYNFLSQHQVDVKHAVPTSDNNGLHNRLGRISDVNRLHTNNPTVNLLDTTTFRPIASVFPPPLRHSTSFSNLHNIKNKMARTPTRRSRNQHNTLKRLQVQILQKINTIQHFIICNTAPVTTVSMATYRRQTALTIRTQIRQVFDLLDQTPTTFPDEENFRHYRGIFEYLRSMVYREEIRLDKIIDDLQDYVTYTLEHGIPRPPVHPNPHMIPYSLNDFMAEISDSSSSDDDDDTLANTA